VNLKELVLMNPGILDQTEIQTIDPVCPKDISPCVSDGIPRGNTTEQGASAGCLNLADSHTRQIKIGIQERADRCAHQIAGDDSSGVASIENSEWCTRL
jgi:hypothetical protein